ncbi:hypothetical protein PWT90_10882 [Aphanocladium album]|nr:hypothetical protein PWT90_10882 [Aphanocladium album]
MASDPGGGHAVADPGTPHASLAHDAARRHPHETVPQEATRTYRPVVAESRPIPAALTRIPSGDLHAPRSRIGELHRRRSQTLYLGGSANSEAAGRSGGTGVQKPSARPPEQASASLRKHGSSTDLYRPGAAAAATRERMRQMLEAAASAENLTVSPTSPTRITIDDKQKTPMTKTRPIAVPRSRPRPDLDVEMLEANMPPPPPPTRSNGTTTATTFINTPSTTIPTTAMISSSLPIESRNDSLAPSRGTTTNGNGGGLKRSASNSSETVTIYECPALEVDDQCGNDEDLSWLNNDKELEQMLAMSSSHRRTGARSSLAFKRSSEAAMQCSQVVRNVPRMRKRRDRKLDRRRLSSTRSESTICLSSSPSPTPTLAG